MYSKKRVAAGALLAAAVGLPTARVRAALSGFSGFAAVNQTSSDSGTVGTNTGIGYTTGGAAFNLTTNGNQEATSGFATTPQSITGSFSASFTYQETPQAYDANGNYVAADGFALVLQNDPRGTAALGGDGGAFGYAAPPSANTNTAVSTITNSAAVAVNNFGGYLNYGGSVGLNYNGSTSTPNGLGNVSLIKNGTATTPADAINVTFSYSATAGQLRETFVDPTAGTKYVHIDTGVNLASVVGGPTALVGFSGGTGGFNAAQTISNFTFNTSTPVAVVAPSATAVYSPVPLTAGSFNQAIVVPAAASGLGTNTSNAAVAKYVTATMDVGVSSTLTTSSGDTWFEKGFVAGSGVTPSNTSAGLPTSGSTFTSQSDARHSFTMPTFGLSAGGTPINDVALLDDKTAADTTATLAFATPKAYSALSFLLATGNGPSEFGLQVNYANGTTAKIPGDVLTPDWFGTGTLAYATGGRYEIDNNSYDIHSSGQPDLWQVDVGLPASSLAISGLTLTYDGSDGSEVSLFAVSGAPAAVPEPASAGLLALAGGALAARRRRRRHA